VGEVVYTAYSGSHQDAIRKCLLKQQPNQPWNVAYLPIDPKDLGRDYEAIIRVNSQSGKAGSAFVLAQEYGLNLPKWVQVDFAPVAQTLAEKQGGVVSHLDLYSAFSDYYRLNQHDIALNHYQLDKSGQQERLSIEVDGETWTGLGNGTLSALCDAWKNRTGQTVEIIDYAEHALHLESSIETGKEAFAMAYVLVQRNQSESQSQVVGVAMAKDSVSAMVLALLKGLKGLE
jgi:2-isopropylmalate synthase